MDGRDIVLLPTSKQEEITGDPIEGDVAEKYGKVYAFMWHGKRDVTRDYAELMGLELPLGKEDYL